MTCLNNDEVSLTWLISRNDLWVGKKLLAARLAISPECVRCSDLEESIEYAFFYFPVERQLCKPLESYIVRILNGRFFFYLEVSSVCSNVMLSLNRSEYYVFLCLLGVLRVGIWAKQQNEFHEGESFLSQTLLTFYKHQIKGSGLRERDSLHWGLAKGR